MPISYESQIYTEIERVFKESGILYEREVKIGSRMRIDFLCGNVGVEVKKGKPNRCKVEKQVTRYCKSDRINSLVLVVERSLFSHLNESNGKKVYYVALNKLWGLSV
jgi:hypothetical protein